MTTNYTPAFFVDLTSKASYIREIEPILSFKDRDDYVAFVKGWRLEYADITQEIRGRKAIRMDKSLAIGVRNSAQEYRQQLRKKANTLMRIRAAAKSHARAAHAAKLAAAA